MRISNLDTWPKGQLYANLPLFLLPICLRPKLHHISSTFFLCVGDSFSWQLIMDVRFRHVQIVKHLFYSSISVNEWILGSTYGFHVAVKSHFQSINIWFVKHKFCAEKSRLICDQTLFVNEITLIQVKATKKVLTLRTLDLSDIT